MLATSTNAFSLDLRARNDPVGAESPIHLNPSEQAQKKRLSFRKAQPREKGKDTSD